MFNKRNFNTHLKHLKHFKFWSVKKTAWESSFYKEKASSVIRVNKGQHITDSVGIVNAAADYAVRPIFYNVVSTVFLSSVFLIRWCDQMQNLTGKMGF